MGMMMPYSRGMRSRNKDMKILETEHLGKFLSALYGGAYRVHGGGFAGTIHINEYLSNRSA